MIHSFFEKNLALSWRAPQENDAKFRFPIHVLVLVLVDYLAGLQEEHNAKVELSTTNYA